MIKRLILLLIISLGFFVNADAEEKCEMTADEKYFLWEGKYALAPELTFTTDGRSRRNIGFLPTGTLLFPYSEGREIEEIDGEQWKKWRTQYGDKVFLTTMSKNRRGILKTNPLDIPLDKDAVIFNIEQYICKDGEESHCNDDENGQKISVGWIARKKGPESGKVAFKYRIMNEQGIKDDGIGYLQSEVFEKRVRSGAITIVNKKHPQLCVHKMTREEKLSLKCAEKGSTATIDSYGIKFGLSWKKFFGVEVGIGSEREQTRVVSYGDDEYANDYYTLEVGMWNDDNQEYAKELYLINALINCSGSSTILRKETIQTVSIKKETNSQGSKIEYIDFSNFYDSYKDLPDEKKKELHHKLKGRPFLTSMNHTSEYARILCIWRKNMPSFDINLARILMNEFNASCQKGDRNACHIITKTMRTADTECSLF